MCETDKPMGNCCVTQEAQPMPCDNPRAWDGVQEVEEVQEGERENIFRDLRERETEIIDWTFRLT